MAPQSKPTLDELPMKILQRVCLLLDRDNICSLRLVSRSLHSRTCHGVFDTFLPRIVFDDINGQVDWLDEDSMYRYMDPNMGPGRGQSPLFEPAARPAPPLKKLPDRLSPLQRVGVTSTPKSACTPSSSSPQAKRLTDIARPSTRATSIEFRLGKAQSGQELEGEAAFRTAAFLFRTTLLSLVADAVLVEEMIVFAWGLRFGLACNFIGPVVDSLSPAPHFEHLKRLSLCLSQHFKLSRTFGELDESREAGEKNADDIRRFIQLFPRLEVLILRWYRVCGKGTPRWSAAHEEEDRFLDHLADLPKEHWRHLRDLRLRGIHTNPATLLKLMNKIPQLRRLTMESIRLTAGTYRPVFDAITEKLRLDHLYLDDLWGVPGKIKSYDPETSTYLDYQGGGFDEPDKYIFYPLICFDAPGEPRLGYNASSNGPDTLTRDGWGPRESMGGGSVPRWLSSCVDRVLRQVQPKIGYGPVFGDLCGQPGKKRWNEHLQALYGERDYGGNPVHG